MSSALSARPDLWHTAAMTMSTTQRGVMDRFLAGAMPVTLAVGFAQAAACPSPPAPTSAPLSAGLAATSPSTSPSPPAPRDPVPQAPTPSLAPAPVPSPPWTVRVFDGSGNVWRLWRDSGALPAAFAYEPMSPERSSSGTFSGGEARSGRLTSMQEGLLWQHVQRLHADTAHHIDARRMGTLALEVTIATAAPGTTLVAGSSAVDDVLVFCGSLGPAGD